VCWIAPIGVCAQKGGLQTNPNVDLYVSASARTEGNGTRQTPFQRIERAIEQSKQLKQRTPDARITIHLLRGIYHLTSPIRITPELSGLTIQGEGASNVSVRGSTKLQLQWRRYNAQIQVASVPKGTDFDQFFVNDQPQILARYPNYNEQGGHWQGHAADAYSIERIKTWKHPIGAWIHVMHSGEWGGFHYEITGLNPDGSAILSGGYQNNRPSRPHPEFRMVENVFEELDSIGEWYLDREKSLLYFYADPKINLKTATFEGSALKHLVEIIGDEAHPVRNVRIEGIQFAHSRRTFMEQYEPLLRSDWTIYRGGALLMEGTENCSILNNEFVHLGGNVIFVSRYNQGARIAENHIHESGASGISFVGDPSAVRSPSFQYGKFVSFDQMDKQYGPKSNAFPREIIAENNLIYRIGRVEKQTAGVQIAMAMDITVRHNSIYDVPRAGINIGDGTWGGHLIEGNDVFNTVLESGDHGSFNSWGRDRYWHPNRSVMDSLAAANPSMPFWDAIHTTIIRNNRFRCDHGWDIDLDDGSSNYQIYNNLSLNGGIKLREGFHRTVENNIMVNNSFHPHVWFVNSDDVFRKNIVMADYKDIALNGWGKELDFNFFPTEAALQKAQKNHTDAHSSIGDPQFIKPESGDFRVSSTSPALALGFLNFPMDQFGVLKPELRAIAKTPVIPALITRSSQANSTAEVLWLGAKLKNITTIEERSASGLENTSGVRILSVESSSLAQKAGLNIGDVIVGVENASIATIADLLNAYQEHNWKGAMQLTIFRNQSAQKITLKTK
jgi:hypothetical protein